MMSSNHDAGEFGVVYQSHLTSWQGRNEAELVAVKTLKGRHRKYFTFKTSNTV